MPKKVIDSYTGDEYVEDYRSPYKGINQPRTLFRSSESGSAEYHAREEGGVWTVHRDLTPPSFFPPLPTEEAARRVLDWCVRFDKDIEEVIRRMKVLQDWDAYFNLLDWIKEAACAND